MIQNLIIKFKENKYLIIGIIILLILLYVFYPVVRDRFFPAKTTIDTAKIELVKKVAQLEKSLDSTQVLYDSSRVVTNRLTNVINEKKAIIIYRTKYLYITDSDKLQKLLTDRLDSIKAHYIEY